jgi:FlaA1/EpsC-like NDP-sugar epimerase
MKKKLKNLQTFEQHTDKNLNIYGVRSSEKINEQLENHDEKERLEYERGIELYKQAIENIEEAMVLFENSPWGLPDEFDRLFGKRQGNEALWNLQKEVRYLKENMDEN